MSNQPNKDKSNRAKARRKAREAQRLPGAGAGRPVPIRSPEGQPAVASLAELAKAGGQVPLNIPQLMSKLGAMTIERDFWMSAAVQLEAQVNMLTGGAAAPSVEEVAASEEEEVQDIPTTLEKCPGCSVTLGPEAVHSDNCTFEGHISTEGEFAPEEDEPSPIGANVPDESLPTELSPEEQEVVDEANLIQALQQEAAEESLVSAEEVETVRQATDN